MKLVENAAIEFKREYVDDVKKSVIAFANTNGGTIYIGIDDNGNIVGVEDLDNTCLRVSNAIRDTIKPDVTLFVAYETETIDEKPVIKIIVQKGTAGPYYLEARALGLRGFMFVRVCPLFLQQKQEF